MRKVIFQFDEPPSTVEVFKALGYLSTWSMSYPTVYIQKEGKTDFIATYFDEGDNHRYTIGAIWDGEHYGFHS